MHSSRCPGNHWHFSAEAGDIYISGADDAYVSDVPRFNVSKFGVAIEGASGPGSPRVSAAPPVAFLQ